MRDKRGLSLPWEVLIPLIVTITLVVGYFFVAKSGGGTIGSALDRFFSLFKFG